MAKTTRRAQLTREKILDAALALVAKSGPENLTLTEVVRQSGVHRATIYQHFQTRDDVLQAASERFATKFYSEVLATIQGSPAPLPGGQPIIDLTKRFAEFVMDNPDLGQIWLDRLLHSGEPAKDPIWAEYLGSYRRLLGSDAAQPNLDPEVLGMMILCATVLWPLWSRTHTKGKAARKASVERFTENLFRVSLSGILKPELFPAISEYLDGLDRKRER